jgi:hypothetical protein
MKIIHGVQRRAAGCPSAPAAARRPSRARAAGAPVRSTERLEFGGAPPIENRSKRSDSKFICGGSGDSLFLADHNPAIGRGFTKHCECVNGGHESAGAAQMAYWKCRKPNKIIPFQLNMSGRVTPELCEVSPTHP